MGLTWRGTGHEPGIAVRTRRGGGEVGALDAVGRRARGWAGSRDRGKGRRILFASAWVGEADCVRYRLSERLLGLGLRFVNVRGTATAADRAPHGHSTSGERGRRSASRPRAGEAAQADEPQPDIVSREEWGADEGKPRAGPTWAG